VILQESRSVSGAWVSWIERHMGPGRFPAHGGRLATPRAPPLGSVATVAEAVLASTVGPPWASLPGAGGVP